MDCTAPFSLWTFFVDPARLGTSCRAVLEEVALARGLTLSDYLLAFFSTCLAEGPVYWLALRWRATFLGPPAPLFTSARLALIIVVINLCTHPLVVFGIPEMGAQMEHPYARAILAGETFAPLVEMLMLRAVFAVPWRRAVIGAVSANLWSWTLGAFIHL